MQYDGDGYGDDDGDGDGGGEVEAFRQVGWLRQHQRFNRLRAFYRSELPQTQSFPSAQSFPWETLLLPKRGSLKRGSLKQALKQARKQALRQALKRVLKRVLIDSIHSVYSTSETCQPIVKTG